MLEGNTKRIKWSAIQQWMIAFLNVATTLILVNFIHWTIWCFYRKTTVIIGLLTVFQGGCIFVHNISKKCYK